ncbi:3'-5' exonuclease [Vibrio hannami]|uniref:3'-5' exonuclease n=1 Tax=Vibrio hannami TaxID=2717094 RepID=UPI002410260F|nr:3'-5' exonuclease [Vibrio hannami]MDG3084841.1 3'-5' exonuclease [Vibrio hannami]
MFDFLNRFKNTSRKKSQRSYAPNELWSPALHKYMDTPLPSTCMDKSQAKFIAIDFETTGLNFEHDKILSIGSVELSSNEIYYSTSSEVYVNHGQYVKPSSACVNKLTPKQLANGHDIKVAMEELLQSIAGKVVLAHGAMIEKGFIDSFMREHYRIDELPCLFVDTLELEKRFSYRARMRQHTSYQLNDLRTHYKLPKYQEHSAASDAASCAELFLVQQKKLTQLEKATLADLIFT